MSIPRNLGNFADNVNTNGKVEVTGINATGTPTASTALLGNGTWGTVTTAPAGSTGQVQYNNAGAFGAISSGTSGQVLTSAGSGSAPTWATPATPSSGLNLVQTVNASGSTVLVDGFSSTYDNYTLQITDLVPAADNRNFELQFYIDSTLITFSYDYAYMNVNSSSGNSNIGSTGNSTIRLANAMTRSFADRANNYVIDIFAVNGATTWKSIIYRGVYHISNVTYTIIGSGTQTDSSGKLTGMQFAFPGSSFTSGKFQLYGYAKA